MHRCPFQVSLVKNRWHWLRGVLFHSPGKPIYFSLEAAYGSMHPFVTRLADLYCTGEAGEEEAVLAARHFTDPDLGSASK